MTTDDMLVQLLEGQKQLFNEVSGLRGEMNDLRQEMTDLRQEMTDEISGLRQEMTEEISGLRQEMTDEISGLRQEMTDEVTSLRQEMADLRQDMTDEISGLRQEMNAKFNEVNYNELELLNRQEAMQSDISSIKLTLENEIRSDLRLLAEGHSGNAEQIIMLKKNVEKINDDNAAESVITGMRQQGMI